MLSSKRSQVIELLESWAGTRDRVLSEWSEPLTLIAEHHWGKHLTHSDQGDRVAEGLVVLRCADARATAVLARTDHADKRLWLTRRAKLRLQIADAIHPSDPEAGRVLAGEQNNSALPTYLRLTAANRRLKRSGSLVPGECDAVVHSGLELYRSCRHDEVAADFLATAVSAVREQGASAALEQIAAIAAEKLGRLLGGAPGARRQKLAVAFTNAKAAEGRTGADAYAVLARSMKLLGLVLDPAAEFDGSRALAMVRDAAACEEAGAIAGALSAYSNLSPFTLYEIAKTMRWLGRLDEADRYAPLLLGVFRWRLSTRQRLHESAFCSSWRGAWREKARWPVVCCAANRHVKMRTSPAPGRPNATRVAAFRLRNRCC